MGRGKRATVSRGGQSSPGQGGASYGSWGSRPSSVAQRPNPYASTRSSASGRPTNFIEHATIIKKLYPKPGQPERDSGWTVAIARDEQTGENVKLIGTFGPVEEGEHIVIKNDLDKEPPWQSSDYGWEYKVWSLDHADPISRPALKAYLDNLPGVGPKLSEAIISTFAGGGPFDGAKILAALDEDPERLRQVRGAHGHAIRADIEELVATWQSLRGERKEMLFLSSLEIGDSTSKRIRKHFHEKGIDPVGAIKKDPFCLMDVEGVGFKIADLTAKRLGVRFDDPRRLAAGLSYVLEEAKENASHLCLPKDLLLRKSPAYLTRDGRRPTRALLEQALDEAVQTGRLVSYTDEADGVERVYTTQMYLVETRLYSQLQRMLTHEKLEPPEDLPLERPADSFLTDEQYQATVNAFQEKFSILTGGPGTGKTTSLKSLLDELDKRGQKYLCMAPTGKAAKRMSEATGRQASTIHRALGGVGGLAVPRSLEEEPPEDRRLNVDVVIVDEVSMLDAELAERLLSHVAERSRVVFVGDPDQLPPVGPGAVLLDLLESGRAPTAHLTQVHRQAQGSLLVVNAHRIKDGKEPYWTREEAEQDLGHPVVDDFLFLEVGSAPAARDEVIEQVDRLADQLGLPASDVLVTAPFRKGEAGVFRLNRILQEKNNPHGEVVRDDDKRPLRVGDVVMNTKNLYGSKRNQNSASQFASYDVMNGDMGKILDWDEHKKYALIDFGEGPMKFEGEELAKVEPAYAATVHKLQGSQGPALIMPLTGGDSSWLISRNHVYTGMTRAQEKCVLVADSKETVRGVLSRVFERETTLDLRVGRIEQRLRAAWEQVKDFEAKWEQYTQSRELPKLARPRAGLAA